VKTVDEYFEKAMSLHENRNDKQRAEVIAALHSANYQPEVALEELKNKPVKVTVLQEWSLVDKETFLKGIKTYGKELHLIKKMVCFIYLFLFLLISFWLSLLSSSSYQRSQQRRSLSIFICGRGRQKPLRPSEKMWTRMMIAICTTSTLHGFCHHQSQPL
jgi:hypothetical protein